ncbi:hypothetical protein BpHYR1_030244 [Brachionus plicatilis]|uniref:Uncharacterized protein n=1 Tax=Brachionus plicatilis TaxID=10195 RepID=A0A3M7RYN2_BRAPC|nr:hypothetical protein BpHYR1_030244 [Brachionus plicatilis]
MISNEISIELRMLNNSKKTRFLKNLPSKFSNKSNLVYRYFCLHYHFANAQSVLPFKTKAISVFASEHHVNDCFRTIYCFPTILSIL